MGGASPALGMVDLLVSIGSDITMRVVLFAQSVVLISYECGDR
jgi:hypothetical protein